MRKNIINPKTGRPFVYMTREQAVRASFKRGGEAVRWGKSAWKLQIETEIPSTLRTTYTEGEAI